MLLQCLPCTLRKRTFLFLSTAVAVSSKLSFLTSFHQHLTSIFKLPKSPKIFSICLYMSILHFLRPYLSHPFERPVGFSFQPGAMRSPLSSPRRSASRAPFRCQCLERSGPAHHLDEAFPVRFFGWLGVGLSEKVPKKRVFLFIWYIVYLELTKIQTLNVTLKICYFLGLFVKVGWDFVFEQHIMLGAIFYNDVGKIGEVWIGNCKDSSPILHRNFIAWNLKLGMK